MISIGQFKKLNNEYLDITCLDIDDSKKLRMTDEQAKILIERVSVRQGTVLCLAPEI